MTQVTFKVFFLLIIMPYNQLFAYNSYAKYDLSDTVLVMEYISKAREAINHSADSAKFYAKKAIQLSEKIGFRNGIAWGNHRLSQVYDYKGLSDSAIIFGNQAKKYFRQTGDYYGLAYSLYTLGNIYLYKSWYETSLKYYSESHDVHQKNDNLSGTNDCYAGIALIYFFRKEYHTCIHYLKLTALHEKETNDEEGLPETYFNIGCAYYELGLNDSARYFYILAENIAEKTSNYRTLSAINNNMGEIAKDEKNYIKAIEHFQKSIALKSQLGYYDGLGETYINIGSVYAETGDYKKALDNILLGIENCKQYNANEDLITGYLMLSELYEKTGDKGMALSTYKDYIRVHDTLIERKFTEQIAEWQTLYHLKDMEFNLESTKSLLSAKQVESQIDKIVQYSLIGFILVIIFISVLIYRYIQNKNIIAKQNIELQDHRIKQLENERILLATRSVLKGEESERRRLARDLHDGLGGYLSGVKIAFSSIKCNKVLPSDTAEEFNYALGLLDKSIKELRRVARNMLPETLLKLGLKCSIADYCSEQDKINSLKIIFQCFGAFERVDSNLEINAFRVIQELANNTIKHANAQQLVIQMLQEPDRLCFIVQDDGIGFNFRDEVLTKGIGLATVKSRVEALNGKMEIISTPGKGSEFNIEFPVSTS